MSFDREWDSTIPLSSWRIGKAAEEIRNTKENFQQRMEVDHNFAAETLDDSLATSDGTHKKITMAVRSKPMFLSDCGILYTKNVDSVSQLFMVDSSNEEIQITGMGGQNVLASNIYNTERTISGDDTAAGISVSIDIEKMRAIKAIYVMTMIAEPLTQVWLKCSGLSYFSNLYLPFSSCFEGTESRIAISALGIADAGSFNIYPYYGKSITVKSSRLYILKEY